MGVKATWIIISLVLTGVVGWLDLLTGYEFSFSIFYLLPISLATWKCGKVGGILISVASAGCWLVVEETLHSPVMFEWMSRQLPMLSTQVKLAPSYSSAITPYWNAVVRLVFFLVTTFLISGSRDSARGRRKLPRER